MFSPFSFSSPISLTLARTLLYNLHSKVLVQRSHFALILFAHWRNRKVNIFSRIHYPTTHKILNFFHSRSLPHNTFTVLLRQWIFKLKRFSNTATTSSTKPRVHSSTSQTRMREWARMGAYNVHTQKKKETHYYFSAQCFNFFFSFSISRAIKQTKHEKKWKWNMLKQRTVEKKKHKIDGRARQRVGKKIHTENKFTVRWARSLKIACRQNYVCLKQETLQRKVKQRLAAVDDWRGLWIRSERVWALVGTLHSWKQCNIVERISN